jgi:hypothetical protein
MLKLVGLMILLIISWPLAVIALLAWPVVWLLSLPFRLVGISVRAAFDLIDAVIRLPARLLRGAVRGQAA